MKKMLALLAVLCLPLRHLPKTTRLCVGKTIVGNITVSNNDAVGGINPGPLLGARSAEGLASNLATGHVSFDVDGLVLNGGNATALRDR